MPDVKLVTPLIHNLSFHYRIIFSRPQRINHLLFPALWSTITKTVIVVYGEDKRADEAETIVDMVNMRHLHRQW